VIERFFTSGITAHQREAIGPLPRGHGLLGLIVRENRAYRIPDIAAHEHSHGFPPHHPPMSSFLGVPIRIRGTVFGNMYLTEKKGGSPFTEHDQLLVQALATAAGFVIENASAFALSERRRQWLEASVRISETLQPPIRLAPALRQIAITARSVTGASAVAVLRREDSDRYLVASVDGPGAESVGDLADRLYDNILQCEQSSEESTVTDGAEGTVVLIPLKAHLAASGVLLVLLEQGRGFLQGEERDLLISFADQASQALDRAHAVAASEELAVVSDRERIARDLHDLVIQQLFATGLMLQGASRLTDPDAVSTRIDQAVTDLDGTIRDIRSTIFALKNEGQGSLRDGVHTLVREYAPVLGFTPALRTIGPVDTLVPDALGVHLLAVLREALSNVARHAGAARATVDIHVSEGEVLLRVVDDGTGFPADRDESGLLNVRRRAHQLGGIVRLAATDPHGTTMEWRVPLNQA
jgi:signal transduction histidine kinase